MALQLHALEHRATDYLRLTVEMLPTQSILQKIHIQLSDQGGQKDVHDQVRTRHKKLECDVARLVTLIINSITALRKTANPVLPVYVIIEDTQLCCPLPSVKAGYTKKVAALRICVTTRAEISLPQQTYTAQTKDSSISAPENEKAMALLDNQRIVKAYYGHMSTDPDYYSYIIPLYIKEVRPADMDNPYRELGVAPTRANDHYPGAQEQEGTFLGDLAQYPEVQLDTVKTVLELIKWYHGPTKRHTGEPFYLHPLAVAHIVVDYNQEQATILADLLPDTVKDTSMLLGHIEEIFGKDTAAIVDKVTHFERKKDSHFCDHVMNRIDSLLSSSRKRASYFAL